MSHFKKREHWTVHKSLLHIQSPSMVNREPLCQLFWPPFQSSFSCRGLVLPPGFGMLVQTISTVTSTVTGIDKHFDSRIFS